MNQIHTPSFHHRKLEPEWSNDFDFDGSDRRFAFSRQTSFQQPAEPHTPISIISNDSQKPLLSRTVSSIDIPPNIYSSNIKFGDSLSLSSVFRGVMSGNKQMRRLFMLISLNVAYSTAELCIGLLSSRVGLISDAFHLTFGCGLQTFSLFAMAASREKPDRVYTYGYKRVEVLSAFTNALFLLFMSFSLAVEALHAFIQDESEHRHYLIVSAATNLLVNLIGVWFFRNYARINLGKHLHCSQNQFFSSLLNVCEGEGEESQRVNTIILFIEVPIQLLCFWLL